MKFKNVKLISKNGIDKKIESVDIDELTKRRIRDAKESRTR